MKFSRYFSMPDADTFSVPIIGDWVRLYLHRSTVSVDPFARNKRWATYTNDLNPGTAADHHMDALDFCAMLTADGVLADLVIFDPPYSPRQVSESYANVGHKATMADTQSAWWKLRKDAAAKLVAPGGGGSFVRLEQRRNGHQARFRDYRDFACEPRGRT